MTGSSAAGSSAAGFSAGDGFTSTVLVVTGSTSAVSAGACGTAGLASATAPSGSGQPACGAFETPCLVPSGITRNSPSMSLGAVPVAVTVVSPEAVTARPLRLTEAR